MTPEDESTPAVLSHSTKRIVSGRVIPGRYAIVRTLPRPAAEIRFFAACHEYDGTSFIIQEGEIPWTLAIESEKWFRIIGLQTEGSIDLPGFIAEIAATLAQASVSVLVVSSFARDYVLVREADLGRTCECLLRFPAELTFE